MNIEKFIVDLEEEADHLFRDLQPRSLYEPLNYFMRIGGKRIRPIIMALTYKGFREPNEEFKAAALAIELFHNFTLIHDDIMDKSPLRRGNQTVHEKWSANTGILSGDVLLIKAYQMLDKIPEEYRLKTYEAFNKMAELVCKVNNMIWTLRNEMTLHSKSI
jgi:geranylgeranyl diphosphate synthase type II